MKKIPYDYFNERDMSLMFLFLLLCFLIFPELAYKVIYGYVGEDSGDNWIAREIFVYNLLGKPLAFFLSILGYNVYAKGPNIFFEDCSIFHDINTLPRHVGTFFVVNNPN